MSEPRRHIDDAERRARLARRHALHPDHQADDALAATRAVGALHATEPATVYLSVAARVPDITVADIDAALYDDRRLVKQLAMRRTLFTFPRELLPAALGSASARVATAERKRIAKAVVAEGLADDGERWLDRAMDAVLELISDGSAYGAAEIRTLVPAVQGTVGGHTDKKWDRPVQVAPWILTLLGLQGRVGRGVNDGHWRTSRPTWVSLQHWLGESIDPMSEREGYATLVRAWLQRFGPGTEDDVQWWLGATKTAVRNALADLDAVPVSMDHDLAGWVLSDDVDPEPGVEPWAALLPVLDATTMGWKHREFYLDPEHAPLVFDRNGNAGATAWWNGQVVGAWNQDDDARVHLRWCAEVSGPARTALEAQAERLTEWLDGVRVGTVYPSALMRD